MMAETLKFSTSSGLRRRADGPRKKDRAVDHAGVPVVADHFPC
jgi:hypothetical protein